MTLSVLPATLLSLPGKLLTSVAGAPVKAAAQVGLDAVSSWMVAGAETMLHEVVELIGTVTTPSLSLSWFSASYWQMAALAMLLTLPFLFAAAVQAVIQTNVAILVRAAFVDLPIAAISVTLAAPLITLLLAATDQMCSLVGGGGGATGTRFLTLTATQLSGAGSGVMLVVIAVVILLAGMALLIELIMRSAAIYIIVLFLPFGFAAMVWPARRVWIKRLLETLVALILSKFAMVAILSLAVAGLASVSSTPSPLTTALTAMALIVLATLSPWALLRLLPFTELAAGAALMLHQDARQHHLPRRGGSPGSTAGDVGAGLTVDPVMDGVGALRHFVNANSGDGFGPGAGASGQLLRRGGDGELPPGAGASTGGEPAGGPGSGPDAGGGGAGGDPRGILPADSGSVASVLEAAAGAGAGVAAGAGSHSAGAAPTVVGSSGTAGAGDSPGGGELTGGGQTGGELPGGGLTGGGLTGGELPGGGLTGGGLTGGEITRGGMPGAGTASGDGMPAAPGPAEAARGPIDDQAPVFGEGGLMNLARIEDGWVVPLPDAVPTEGDQPAPGEA